LERPTPALELTTGVVIETDGPRQWIRFDRATSAAQVIAEVTARASVRDLTIEEPDIEDLIRTVYASVEQGSGLGTEPGGSGP
ncbi:MAG: methionine ABC transporter ATP-binding protein, partial [Actinomycetota bacterium]